jgi:chaperonin cofactor prefoldin
MPVKATELVPLARQISCVAREIRMRQSAYPRWIEAGKMTKAKADREISEMQAALETLKRLDDTTPIVQTSLF